MSRRVHVFGAAGCGATTLGRALAQRLRCPHLDADDYFWIPTDPPYQRSWPRLKKQALLRADLTRHNGWVLTGAILGWGDVFMPLFDLVVFLRAPAAIRIARIRERERRRFGDAALAPGGALHGHYRQFLARAAAYDGDRLKLRCRRAHEQWLARLACPVQRLDGSEPVRDNLDQILRCVATLDAPESIPGI